MSASGNKEVEIKVAVGDLMTIQSRLESLGYDLKTPRTFESNAIWDTPARDLKRSGEIVRLREFGAKRVLTYKGPAAAGTRHKEREELETDLALLGPLERVFTRLGLEPAFLYEKYRSEYEKPGVAGIVTLDETPIGRFIELEGDPAWIDSVARQLGFEESSYITKSYATLYIEFCAAKQIEPHHMVFERS